METISNTLIVYDASSESPPLSVTLTATVMPVATSSFVGVPERTPVSAPIESHPGPSVSSKVSVSPAFGSVTSIEVLYGESVVASGMVSVVIDGASFGSADTTIVVEKVAVRLGVPESVTTTVTGILSPASFGPGVPERFPVPSMESHAGPSVRLNVCVSPTSGSCTWIAAA